MNNHDNETGLPYVAFCRVSDIDPHESHHRQLGVSADTRLYTEDQVRAAIEADRKRRFESGEALQRYKDCEGDKESDPIERLRFYCSLAMSGQDWLDVEPFFDDLIADRQRRSEPVALTMGQQAVAVELLACFQAWEPMVCVLGNVRARDGAELMQTILNATPQPAEPVKVPSNDLAHEIWAAAQTAPGEGIEDAVERIATLLARYDDPDDWSDEPCFPGPRE